MDDSAMIDAPLPRYAAGDKFYYSDGEIDEIVEVEEEKFKTTSRTVSIVLQFNSLIIPPLYYESKDTLEYQESQVATNALWPLATGNAIRFKTTTRSTNRADGLETVTTRDWHCAVEGAARIRVLAGKFDTFRVACRQLAASGVPVQIRTWFYAPEIGTYVMRHDLHISSAKEYRRELIAVLPSLDLDHEDAKARSSLAGSWQEALESNLSGHESRWEDANSGIAVRVTPQATFRADNGQYCRTYRQYVSHKGSTRTYGGLACRVGKLDWRTPLYPARPVLPAPSLRP